jgi:very-short-patch-repair endonuclease
MPRPAVVEVLHHLGGTASAQDLATLCGRSALARAVDGGLVVRVARGRYALPAWPDPWVSAARLGGVVSHSSAARHWGLAVPSGGARGHVTVGRHRSGLSGRGVVLHWADLAATDVDSHVPVTAPLRTVLDCARSLPFAQALGVADSALRLGRVGRSELRLAADGLQGAGRARVRGVAGAADGRAESPLESTLRATFVLARITGFEPQLAIRDGAFFARVDLGDEPRRIVVEADSFEHHGYRDALVRDCERYDELVMRGWRVLRFAWEQVMFRPEWVVAIVRAVTEQPVPRRTGGQKWAGSARRLA